ncbi:acylglycerol kinase, mitochondrial [Scaptodrosophila lebanonensis]|uniref:Acylglycerol kinase, mitochondrial n=1 Tax=Drosophila lebanonensis TaxID=7225 RepID=A0A6J2U6P4_DROLE|nr:acylglycerol kinase, mitochondrial [Scaptodrosophila lebanonensis]
MNFLTIIRNNWKKSACAAAISGYGIYSMKIHYEITNYMRQLCNDVAFSGGIEDSVPKKVLVVMNPVANKKKAEKSFKKYCEPILHLAGYSVEMLRTSHIGHAKTFIEEMNNLPDAIVVAGGDGTTSEVVTGLMRRNSGNSCPIVLLPLGRTSQSASKYFQHDVKNDVDYVKALSGSLMPLLKGNFKFESVIQYDVLDKEASIDGPKNLKPIFGLNRFSWGLMKDIDAVKDKYWYFGILRHYAAAFFKSFSSSVNWNFETDYIYTPPCPGCSNCFVKSQAKSPSVFFLRNLVAPKTNTGRSENEKTARNDSCTTKFEGRIETNQLNIACNRNEENYSELESEFINSLQPGWDFVKNIPNITKNAITPNLVLRSRTIQLYPIADTSNIFYSIDGEEYDARPIKVSVVPNAIKVCC